MAEWYSIVYMEAFLKDHSKKRQTQGNTTIENFKGLALSMSYTVKK